MSSYAYIDYKDEDDILRTYSQEQLDARQDFIDMLEGHSTELIYEPKEVRPTDPGVLVRQIGPPADYNFRNAFIKYLKKIAKIFFTIDPHDFIPLAVDLMDHYMCVHKGEKMPFDPMSGRSATNYMDQIREIPEVQEFLASETIEEDVPYTSPTPPSVFYKKIHACIKSHSLTPDRIYQVDLMTQKYQLDERQHDPTPDHCLDSQQDVESVTLRVCANAEGRPFEARVHCDYDFDIESFPEFLNDLKNHANPSPTKPILLLMCRKLKAFTLDLLDMCEKEGIILYAFPFYAKPLEPLSQFIIPMIRHQFNEEYKEKYQVKGKKSVGTPEGASALIKSIIDKVQSSNVETTKKDFRKCLQLDKCIKFPASDVAKEIEQMEVEGEAAASLSFNYEDEEIAGYDASKDWHLKLLKKLKMKKRKPHASDEELNELMFAQIGPLKVSDYYHY